MVTFCHYRIRYFKSSILLFLSICVYVCVGCGIAGLKGLDAVVHHSPTLSKQQAKDEVYATVREIINIIPKEVANIEEVQFYYESGYGGSNAGPPFRAVMDIIVNTHPQYDNEHVSNTYRNILLKLPGWGASIQDIHSHSPVIYKDDMFIYLPSVSWRTFEINGPLYVYEDLREVPDHWDDNGAHGPLHAEDVTKDFLSPKPIIGQRKTS